MRERTFPEIRPGFINRSDANTFNRGLDAIERLSNFQASHGLRSYIGSAGTFSVWDHRPGFWGRITDSHFNESEGIWVYAWEATYRDFDKQTYVFEVDYPYENTLNVAVDPPVPLPAYEVNNKKTPEGTIVWLRSGMGDWLEFEYCCEGRITTPGEDIELTEDTNDLVIESTTSWLRLQPDADHVLTGITITEGPSDGRVLTVTNVSDTYSITLAHQSASSSAENRFELATQTDYVILPNQTVTFRYDEDTGPFWRQGEQTGPGGGAQYLPQETTTIGSNQTDFDLASFPSPWLGIEPTSADRTIFSIDPGDGLTTGRVLTLTNTSTTYDLILADEYTTGTTAAFRINTTTGEDQRVRPGDTVWLLYDPTLSRWRTTSTTYSDLVDPRTTTIDLTADTDNLDTGLIGNQTIYLTSTGGPWDLTGVDTSAFALGTTITFVNTESTVVTLTHQDGSSSAGNQFDNGAWDDLDLQESDTVTYLITNDGPLVQSTTVAQPGSVDSLPTTPATSATTLAVVPVWRKYTITHTTVADASTDFTATIDTLPARTRVHEAAIIIETSWNGPTSVTLSPEFGGNNYITVNAKGSPGTADVTPHNGGGSAVSSSNGQGEYIGLFMSAVDVDIHATSSGGNLDTASTGTASLYLLVTTLP